MPEIVREFFNHHECGFVKQVSLCPGMNKRNQEGDMNYFFMWAYFFYAGVLLVSGCSITTVTTEKNDFGIYNNKTIYQTQKDLFLVKRRYTLDNKTLVLFCPAVSILPSIEEYISNPKHAWPESDASDLGKH
jgi:hypothetical protein